MLQGDETGQRNLCKYLFGFQDGTAKLYPEPEDKELFVRTQAYQTDYEEMLPNMMVCWDRAKNSNKSGEYTLEPTLGAAEFQGVQLMGTRSHKCENDDVNCD